MLSLGRHYDLQVNVCRTLTEFREICDVWDALCCDAPVGGPSLSFRVLELLTQFFSNYKHLFIFLFYDGGRLVGGMPLMHARPRMGQLDPLCSYLTSLQNWRTPVPTFPILQGWGKRVWNSFLALLKSQKIKWNVVLLPQHRVREPEFGQHFIEGSLRAARLPHVIHFHEVGLVSLEGDFAAYARRLKGHFRRGIERQIRRLEQRGSLRLVGVTDRERVTNAFEEFCRLEDLTWKGSQGVSFLRKPADKSLACDLFSYFASLGKFICYNLLVKENLIASLLCHPDGDTVYAMKVSYDPAYSKFSPGNVLFWLVLRELFPRTDVRTFDFVGGVNQDHSYNKHFPSDFRQEARIVIFNPRSVPAALARFSIALGKGLKSRGVLKRTLLTLKRPWLFRKRERLQS